MSSNIFISYCWDDFDRVNCIDNIFNRFGIHLIRDIRNLDYDTNIHRFMDKITEYEKIIVYLSDSYLKSLNCMYEAAQILKRKDKFTIIIKKGTKIFKVEDKENLIRYWKEKYEEIVNKDIVKFREEISDTKIAYDTISEFIDFVKKSKRMFDESIDFTKLLEHLEVSKEYPEIITKDVINWVGKYPNANMFDVVALICDLYKSKTVLISEFSNIPDNEIKYYFNDISFSRNMNGIDLAIAVQTIDTEEYSNVIYSRLVEIKENTTRSNRHSKYYFYCENTTKKQRWTELKNRSLFAMLKKEELDFLEAGYCDVFRITINF